MVVKWVAFISTISTPMEVAGNLVSFIPICWTSTTVSSEGKKQNNVSFATEVT